MKQQLRSGKEIRLIKNSLLTGEILSDLSLPVDNTFFQIIAIPEERRRQFLAFMDPGFNKDAYSLTFLSSFLWFKKKCDTNLHGEKRPCISCSFCEEACPVGLIPHLIYRYVERDIIEEDLMNLKIFNCLECNLCSYVCPSKIPVAKYIKEGKAKLIENGFDPSSHILKSFNLKSVEK